MRSRLRILFLLLICALALPAMAQQNPGGPPPPPQRRGDFNPPVTDADEAQTRMANEAAKKAAKERIAALKTDTDKLLKLSVELKQYVDKSDENVLSLDVVKKADEIEKLAKSVKEKMKGQN
ncbi:MAG TPA: hypothetical protein VK302_22420 [Terriglobales bacterium]|nr:hypothetical protein [Terriglobales bacterium]